MEIAIESDTRGAPVVGNSSQIIHGIYVPMPPGMPTPTKKNCLSFETVLLRSIVKMIDS